MLRRIIHCLLFLTLVCALSGCIFFRLSRVLVQLKTPNQYLKVNFEQQVFKAALLQKIIYLSDIESIIGRKTTKSESDYFFFKFKKTKINDRLPWVIKFWVDKKKLITRFELPEKLTTIIGNRVIFNCIKAIGYAEISIGKKRIYLTSKDKIMLSQINQLLGKPIKQINSTSIYNFVSGKTHFNVHIQSKQELIQSLLISANGYSIEMDFSLLK
jgi:hypothetical protein